MIKVEVDIDALMERTADDKELACDLLACLENDLPEKRKMLEMAAGEMNFQQMASLLHAMKGEVGIFGFVNVDKSIVGMEVEAKGCADADYVKNIAVLFDSIGEHIVELKKLLNK